MLGALIKKELLALTRDVHGMAALFLMPVMFIVIMSLALKDVYDPPLRTLRHATPAPPPRTCSPPGPGAMAPRWICRPTGRRSCATAG